MEDTIDAMINTSRTVDGKPTSLRDLGYVHVGLDGGWNKCFAENHTFHLADGALAHSRTRRPAEGCPADSCTLERMKTQLGRSTLERVHERGAAQAPRFGTSDFLSRSAWSTRHMLLACSRAGTLTIGALLTMPNGACLPYPLCSLLSDDRACVPRVRTANQWLCREPHH
mgnify:CR=1 FL=1